MISPQEHREGTRRSGLNSVTDNNLTSRTHHLYYTFCSQIAGDVHPYTVNSFTPQAVGPRYYACEEPWVRFKCCEEQTWIQNEFQRLIMKSGPTSEAKAKAFLGLNGLIGYLRRANRCRRYDDLNESGRYVIDEAGDKPLSR